MGGGIEHTQLPTHSFPNDASCVPHFEWAAGASLTGSRMLLRSRHWKKLSRASQHRARCDLLGAMPLVGSGEGDEDPELNQPIVYFPRWASEFVGGENCLVEGFSGG